MIGAVHAEQGDLSDAKRYFKAANRVARKHELELFEHSTARMYFETKFRELLEGGASAVELSKCAEKLGDACYDCEDMVSAAEHYAKVRCLQGVVFVTFRLIGVFLVTRK